MILSPLMGSVVRLVSRAPGCLGTLEIILAWLAAPFSDQCARLASLYL